MRQIEQSSLREQARAMIRASIISGELEPGEIYSAVGLAERLGVSPTPVREAMLDLASDGLVEAVRNRGYRIRIADERELDEISQLRSIIEAGAAFEVAKQATDEQLKGMEDRLDALEGAAAADDPTAYLRADRDFHVAIADVLDNGRLTRLIEQLRDQTRLVGIKPLAAAGELEVSAAEHRPILEALQDRDAERARDLMVRHLRHTRGIWAGVPEDSGGT
jgi:DNA-binding GntR family transcriptional regulator